jgi:hypothetical protein
VVLRGDALDAPSPRIGEKDSWTRSTRTRRRCQQKEEAETEVRRGRSGEALYTALRSAPHDHMHPPSATGASQEALLELAFGATPLDAAAPRSVSDSER